MTGTLRRRPDIHYLPRYSRRRPLPNNTGPDIAIGRRAGTESDAALNSLERLLRSAVRF